MRSSIDSGQIFDDNSTFIMKIRSRKNRIEKSDKAFLWHPFTQMKEWEKDNPLIITEGKGSYLKDIYGNWYLDGVSSLWVTIHGHGKHEINQAIKDQVDNISHSTLLGLTHPPAAMLAEMLVKITPQSLTRVFYSDSGSTSVEIGLKMAYQYWQLKGKHTKKQFLSLNNAYHGDTIGAVSVGGMELFHHIFSPLLFKTFNAPSPHCYRCELGVVYPDCNMLCLEKMEALLKRHHDEIAAVIIEPHVQGAAGMLVAPPGYVKGVQKLCRKYSVLLIVDEVATGFGRTGKMFACEHENITPDILCLAKGMTGGYLPLAATVTTNKIYRQFLGNYEDFKTFFHGHTYTGNQLACSAAIASLNIFKKEKTLKKLEKKIVALGKALKDFSQFPCVGDIRQMGFMAGIELVRDRKSKEPFPIGRRTAWKVCQRARDKGLIIRPLGDVIILMPPLSISMRELKSLLQITAEAIRDVTEPV